MPVTIVIADALSWVSSLEPVPEDKDNLGVIPVLHITSEIPATRSQLEAVRVEIQADPVLSQLKHQIFQGWPDARGGISDNMYPFWNYYCDELSVEDRLIFKTHKLMFPTSPHLHVGHLGEEKTLFQAWQCAHWPGITDNVKLYIRKCDNTSQQDPTSRRIPSSCMVFLLNVERKFALNFFSTGLMTASQWQITSATSPWPGMLRWK